MNEFVRIAALGLGAGVGATMLTPQISGFVGTLGFDPESRGGKTAASAIAAGVGVFAAEAILKAL